MKLGYAFPTVLIALDVAESIKYMAQGNLRMMIYWLVAAGLAAIYAIYAGGAE